MKLFHKVFLCFVIIFGITFQITGYFLISFAYKNAVEQEKKFAFQEFQYNKYILQSILYSEPEFITDIKKNLSDIEGHFTAPITLYGEDRTCIYSNMAMRPENLSFEEIEDNDNHIIFDILQTVEKSYIYVQNRIIQGEKEIYLVTETDISAIVEAQNKMSAYFQQIYFIIFFIGFPAIFLLTSLLTKPIKQVSMAAKRIAKGNYSERIAVSNRDEIGELAADFNQMAEKVEDKIAELSDTARQKEEFAANFAHELKTPLTSVIGYADMLYQKELSRTQVKSAAEYILNEGMRLEALSLKLMDLFVLDKQEFLLERTPVQELFEDMTQGIQPICEKYKVSFHMNMKDGTLWIDYDLFKTMILNLVDNAVKADCKELWITGENEKKSYQIKIVDNGKGIPPEELGRITEAFYMVDKSRSRKQHGVGLGMALVAKIVEIHKAEMKIESDGKSGTTIYLLFPAQI